MNDFIVTNAVLFHFSVHTQICQIYSRIFLVRVHVQNIFVRVELVTYSLVLLFLILSVSVLCFANE